MCGFTCLLGIPNQVISTELKSNLHQQIATRGPDGSGYWNDPTIGIHLLHTRLSIQDLTEDASQPMHSSSNNSALIYNGEIYNAKTIEESILEIKPFIRKTSGDTELLVEALETLGIDQTLSLLEGMFAFAWWNKKTNQLILARDKFGEKPLYYAHSDHSFIASSSLSTFNHIPPFNKPCEVDRLQAAKMLLTGYNVGQFSIYHGISSLPPGSHFSLSVMHNRIIKNPAQVYFAPNSKKIAERTLSQIPTLSDLDKVIRQSVSSQLISDRPIGTFLSGGIDSSLVTAVAQNLLGRQLSTFSVGFHEPGYDESTYSYEVARDINTNHHHFYIPPAEIPILAKRLKCIWSEPFADQSQFAIAYLCSQASQTVKVALTGDGGDELFCGYNRYNDGLRLYRFVKGNCLFRFLLNHVKSLPFGLIDKYSRCLPKKFHLSATESLYSKLRDISITRNLPQYYLFLLTRSNHKLIAKDLAHHAILSLESDLHEIFDSINYLDAKRQLMVADQLLYLPQDILVKSDRASMAYGLELRAPFLSRPVYDLSIRLDDSQLTDIHGGKVLLKALLKHYLPNVNFNRPKMGFGVPLGKWMRNELREWASDIFSSSFAKQDPLINYHECLNAFNSHLSSKQNNEKQLWPILMYLSWRYDL